LMSLRPLLVTLARRTCTSVKDLVDYWEELYRESKKYPDSEFLRRIKWEGGSLEAEDITWLFGWKYRRLPGWSPSPVIRRLAELNNLRFKEGNPLERATAELSRTGLVKRFFICHILSPLKYPIWDRFVLTAHLMISGREDEIGNVQRLTRDTQEYESYRAAFNTLVTEVPPKMRNGTEFPSFRRLDRALWAMGRHAEIVVRSGRNL
jgi:hypothetical protein